MFDGIFVECRQKAAVNIILSGMVVSAERHGVVVVYIDVFNVQGVEKATQEDGLKFVCRV